MTVPVHVAIVDRTRRRGLTRVAAALSQQAGDFITAWRLHYTVTVAVHSKGTVDPGTWTLELQDGLDEPGAAGYHSDNHHQPYARIDVTAGDWTVTASHELLEMLGDPFGSSLHTAAAPTGWDGPARVKYLREVCDPCEATSYDTGGVAVSDFILPAYYRSTAHGPVSFAGGVTRPQQVAEGGYISWVDPTSGVWWQRFVTGGQVSDRKLGAFDKAAFSSLREFTDHHARLRRAL